MPVKVESWGRYPVATHRSILPLYWQPTHLPSGTGEFLLATGLTRSYGDCCLNDGNSLLAARGMDRFISFDAQTGLLVCEAGVSLEEILTLVVPRGWFIPVTPGTRYVTLAGAIANDVHGKNHHVAGCFGHYVNRIGLLRSDRGELELSTEQNADLFAATIGGLGLTGLILWAEVQLKPIRNCWIDNETVRFEGFPEFLRLSKESEDNFEYIVSWLDCLSPAFRGLFFRGNHNTSRPPVEHTSKNSILQVPLDFPEWVLSPWSVTIFNTAIYWRQIRRHTRQCVRYEPFFYPLDAVGHWNRIYGRRGFMQWQCLIPMSQAADVCPMLLKEVVTAGHASFFTVLKTMGNRPSRGWISFPGPGITMALDFPVNPDVFRLLDRLDEIAFEAGGRLYAAKDARMQARHFQKAYPRWTELEQIRDPRFSSSFWRRVTQPA